MRFAHGCPDYFALAQKSGLSYIGVVAALQRGRSASLLPEAPGLVDHHSPSLPRRSTEIWARCRACSAGPFFFLRLSLLPGRWSGGFPTRTRAAIPHAQVGPVAQWLELAAHNGLVAGSSPAGPTMLPPKSGSPPRARAPRAQAPATANRAAETKKGPAGPCPMTLDAEPGNGGFREPTPAIDPCRHPTRKTW